MRCFVGVPVTGPLARECKELALGLPRATPRPNLHLTLAFLGQCTPAGVGRLSAELRSLADRFAAFDLTFDRCEPFPAEQGPFLALTATCSEALSALHEGLWECLATQTGAWQLTVDQLCLYQSELIQGEVPTYRPLSQHPLAG